MGSKTTRLREAMTRSGLAVEQIAEMAGTNVKTVQRWASGRQVPYRTNRRVLAEILEVPVGQLWPELDRENAKELGDLVAVYPTRTDLPASTIAALTHSAQVHVDLLAYSATWLWDAVPRFGALLANKERDGTHVRLCLGDPDSEAVCRRGEEEGVGASVAARCHLALAYASPIIKDFGDSVRLHDTTLYASIFRFDDDILINWHLWGNAAAQSPLFHFKLGDRLGAATSILNSFEQVWRNSQSLGVG